jgi:hypothetical protein
MAVSSAVTVVCTMEVAGEVQGGENPTVSSQQAEWELKSRGQEADQTK